MYSGILNFTYFHVTKWTKLHCVKEWFLRNIRSVWKCGGKCEIFYKKLFFFHLPKLQLVLEWVRKHKEWIGVAKVILLFHLRFPKPIRSLKAFIIDFNLRHHSHFFLTAKSQMLPGSCSKLQRHVLSRCLTPISSVPPCSFPVIKNCVIKSVFFLSLSHYPLLLSISSTLAA